MNALELRIGNYVIYEDTTHVVLGIESERLIRTYWDKGNDKKDYYDHLIEDVEPIPLTEEWLLKFGFIRVKSANYDFELQIQKDNNEGAPSYWIYADSGTDNETFEFTISIVSNQGDGWLNTTTKYIHQLQNLYLALTGEELNITTT